MLDRSVNSFWNFKYVVFFFVLGVISIFRFLVFGKFLSYKKIVLGKKSHLRQKSRLTRPIFDFIDLWALLGDFRFLIYELLEIAQ